MQKMNRKERVVLNNNKKKGPNISMLKDFVIVDGGFKYIYLSFTLTK
jgi:hypothetical protein